MNLNIRFAKVGAVKQFAHIAAHVKFVIVSRINFGKKHGTAAADSLWRKYCRLGVRSGRNQEKQKCNKQNTDMLHYSNISLTNLSIRVDDSSTGYLKLQVEIFGQLAVLGCVIVVFFELNHQSFL